MTAGLIAGAAAVALVAAPSAMAEEAAPPNPEGGITVNVDIDGVTPICVNAVRVSAFGSRLLDVPKICIGG